MIITIIIVLRSLYCLSVCWLVKINQYNIVIIHGKAIEASQSKAKKKNAE